MAIWLLNQGPSESIGRQRMSGSRAPAARASVRVTAANDFACPSRIARRSLRESALRIGEQTAW